MNDQGKVTADHLRRDAYLYVRQSSLYQVANNTGSFASLSASLNPRRNGAFGLPLLPLAGFSVGVARNSSRR